MSQPDLLIKMKNRSTGYSSDSEQNKQDLSVLRKPIFTALTGFLESKRAYDNGTEEIRRLLSRECDVLYECKVCRNMFRSLTNFISHKRVYCRTAFTNLSNHFNSNNGFIDQDISTIIQAEQDYVNNSTTKDNKSNENSNKDLSSIIERLLKREQANRVLKLTDFYDQVNNKLTQDEILRKKHELQLDRVPNSNIAVYQTVKKDDNDNIRKEVTEVNDLVFNQKNILGTDGKIVSHDNNSKIAGPVDIKCEENDQKPIVNENISCEICNVQFSTEKTLKLHLQTKHISSTFVYQCPSCSQTFLQPRAVFRHLSNDHKKSMRRIRLMRESILRRRVRMDEIQTKGPSRELARLQTDSEKRDAENKAWMDNVELSNNSPMCAYCGKKFERKAVLTTHLNNCSMKNKCAGSQSKRINELAGTSNSHRTEDISPSNTATANDLEELKDIKDLDLSILDDYLSTDRVDPNVSPVSKRKRKRTSKVLQQTVKAESESLDDLFWNIDTTENLSLKTVSINEPVQTEQPDLVEKVESVLKSNKEVSFYCRICVKKFDVLSNLRRHISMFHYRKRKFGCKLCDYRAFRKYDVINHLNSNHSITGERDVVLQYVVVKELKGERNEENIDADVIIAENGTLDSELSSKHLEKRRRRTKIKEPKTTINSPPEPTTIIDVKIESKFTRSSSNLSLSSNEESAISKRPIRNRVKPVNKDFVYDLSNLLKKDMVLSERDSSVALVPAKTQRRRATQNLVDENSRDSVTPPSPAVSNGDAPATEATEGASSTVIFPPIKGSALTMARLAVTTITACFYKPPDLPLERPSILGRLPPTLKIESKSSDWPFIKNDQQSHVMRRISDDSLIQVLSKKRRQEISSRLVNGNTSADTHPPKIELNINGETKMQLTSSQLRDGNTEGDKIMVKLFSTEKEFKECLIANKLTEPITKIPSTFAEIRSIMPPTKSSPNSKRITLMERLAENKKLKMDNMLKSALEN